MSNAETPAKLAVLAAGNMAQAILLAAIRAGAIESQNIVVADPDEVKRTVFTKAGVHTAPSFTDLASHISENTQILLAVKPQILPEAAPDVARTAGESSRVVISILAGATGARVRSLLGDWARVVRVMPNTPAQIGKGISAITQSAGAQPGDDALARALMTSVSDVIDIDESLFDAFTAVAGSGPAYLFYLAEAMTKAAIEVGIDPNDADRTVRAVITGAAALLENQRETAPADLRSAVTSKGGTTAAATNTLDDHNVMQAVINAITAARNRGRELGA